MVDARVGRQRAEEIRRVAGETEKIEKKKENKWKRYNAKVFLSLRLDRTKM